VHPATGIRGRWAGLGLPGLSLPGRIGLMAGIGLLVAGCQLPGGGEPPRTVADVEIHGLGPEAPDVEPRLREILVRWRAVHPTAPLPDLHLEGTEAGGFDAESQVVRMPLPTVDDPAALEDAELRLARELVRAGQAAHPPPPFPLSLFAGGEDLTRRALREGGADFLVHVVAGRHPTPELMEWGRGREVELWRAFLQVMEDPDAPGWYASALDEDGEPAPPGDPLRFVGYRIAEARWERSVDRTQTARELVRLSDPEEFVERSAYDGQGPDPEGPPTVRGLGIAPWPGFECRFFRVGGATVEGCVGGPDEAPVVLDAGDGREMGVWHRVAPLLARSQRVVLVDPQGLLTEEEGGSSLVAVHRLAALLEILAGPGPYVLAGAGTGGARAAAFATLYPWRTGGLAAEGPGGASPSPPLTGRPMVPTSGATSFAPRAHQEAVTELVSLLAEQGRAVAATGPEGRPGWAGEPRGCVRMEAPSLPAWTGGTLRLAHSPDGGEPLRPGSHPVHRLEVSPSALAGAWHPLGTERIVLSLVMDDELVSGELERTGGGVWTGRFPAVPGVGAAAVTLRPHSCELPE
jgi:pimeloyl-ACP methyl ester carboxylesterase